MNRRNFLKNGSLAGFTIPAMVAGSTMIATAENNSTIKHEIMELKDVDLNESTIDQLQQKMQSGDLTSVLITKWYLKRIDEIDKNGDMIELDVNNRRLHLEVSDEELAARKTQWEKPDYVTERGYVNLYVKHVQQADKGADLDFLVGKSGSKVTRDSH